MTEAAAFMQIVPVYAVISFIANRLIVRAKSDTAATLYSAGYFLATLAYIKLIGTIHQVYKQHWINQDNKQALIFLMAVYALCIFIALCNILLSFGLRRRATTNEA